MYMKCYYDNLTAPWERSQYVRFMEIILKIFGNNDGFTRQHAENLVLFIVICGIYFWEKF